MSHLSSALSRAGAVVVVLATMAVVAAAPAVAANGSTACRVVDPTRDTSYKSLQKAVDASPAGARLRVKGTCIGPTTISRNITIVGKTSRFGRPTLDGEYRGSVVTITGGTVTLRGLLFTHGVAASGGGIHVRGNLTLVNSVVSGNTANGDPGEGGGGIGIDSGTITIGNTIVSGNFAKLDGGGIYVGLRSGGDLSIHGTSAVRDNQAGRRAGGIYVQTHSRLWMYDSTSIDHNSANYAGGVHCGDCGIVALNDDVSIHHNDAQVAGGGIESGGLAPTIRMRDRSSIHDNSASDGGGVWLRLAVVLQMSGTSSLINNTARNAGGGAYLSEGARVGVGATATVSGNAPDDCYADDPPGDSPPGVVACVPTGP